MTRSTDPLPIAGDGIVVRGAEPAASTTVLRHMVYGSGLTHSLDYVVLLHTLFRLEENEPFTPLDIWDDLQTEGIRSAKHAGELVGRDAVYQSFNRLITAKFIRRTTQGGVPGRFGKVQYEVYRQPVYNPDFSDKATPLPGTPEAAESDSKTAGRTASRNTGTGVSASGVPGSGQNRIPAGRTAYGVPGSGDGVPPTPPYREEEDSSSRKASSATAVTPGTQTPEVAAAAEYLAELPGRWACGRKTAERLAPLLADAVMTQGWALGDELAQQLTRRFPPRRRVASVLKERIEDLPRYHSVRQADGAPAQAPVGNLDSGERPGAALPDGVTTTQVAQAREFLLTLTGPWALAPENAERLAPLLAAQAAERGWLFDTELRNQLMSNPNGVNNYALVLERHRIGALPFRRSTTGSAPRREVRNARKEAIDACSVCDAYGQVERGGGIVLCKHEAAPVGEAKPAPETAPAPPTPPEQPTSRSLTDLLASMREPTL
ncbi:hypothetical protein ACF1FX_32385 [Streptomyces sp. NPDC014646]|uniref:hypothetical protein n=1 Tax=Streptomyces sp. NPDC014646 TaxID=3364877 RepID=UPI0036F7BE9B